MYLHEARKMYILLLVSSTFTTFQMQERHQKVKDLNLLMNKSNAERLILYDFRERSVNCPE